MKNMSRRRFWAGKALFFGKQLVLVSRPPAPDRNSVPWESDTNRAYSSMGLKIAWNSTFHQIKTFCPTETG